MLNVSGASLGAGELSGRDGLSHHVPVEGEDEDEMFHLRALST